MNAPPQVYSFLCLKILTTAVCGKVVCTNVWLEQFVRAGVKSMEDLSFFLFSLFFFFFKKL